MRPILGNVIQSVTGPNLPQQLCFCMNPPLLRQFACCFAAIIGVGCRQPDADAALIDLEPQAALTIIVGLLAQFRVFGCVLAKPLL